MFVCFKRNTAQKYRHKSQFPTYNKNPEVIILPTTTQGVQEIKQVMLNDRNVKHRYNYNK